MARPLRVAIAGVGTVGGGVAQILNTHRSLLAQRCGRAIDLVAVADQRPAEKLSAELEGHGKVIHYKDAVRMAEESGPEVDVIVETIGGYNVALNVASSALKSGISLVTANKAMLAVHAADLTAAAEKSGAKIGWEAAVGGGIPCIRALREGCAANRISYAAGILNGTCNFILTTMKDTGRAFDDVLAEAQERGYAETPPDLDVDGIDTAHKLSLVAAVATGCLPAYDGVFTEGIRGITSADVALADELGFSIKLLGIASRTEIFEADAEFAEDPFRPCVAAENELGALPVRPEQRGAPPVVLQRVHPALIPKDAALGATHGVLNGLFTVGDFVGPVFSQGRGAGRDATASACVADLIDIARGSTGVPTFGKPLKELDAMVSASMDQRVGRYYLRTNDALAQEAVVKALAAAKIAVETSTSGADGHALITGVTLEATLTDSVLNQLGDAVSMIRVEGPW